VPLPRIPTPAAGSPTVESTVAGLPSMFTPGPNLPLLSRFRRCDVEAREPTRC